MKKALMSIADHDVWTYLNPIHLPLTAVGANSVMLDMSAKSFNLLSRDILKRCNDGCATDADTQNKSTNDNLTHGIAGSNDDGSGSEPGC
jgi:hypothetical protein